MPVALLTIFSIVSFLVGCTLLFLPARRYWFKVSPGAFGAFLACTGFLLMTVFKWTDIAVNFAGLEMRLQAAQAKIAEQATELAAANSELAQANIMLVSAGVGGTESKTEAFIAFSEAIANQLEDEGVAVTADLIYQAIGSTDWKLPEDLAPRTNIPPDDFTASPGPIGPELQLLPTPDNSKSLEYMPAD
jgi:hypothetical protein